MFLTFASLFFPLLDEKVLLYWQAASKECATRGARTSNSNFIHKRFNENTFNEIDPLCKVVMLMLIKYSFFNHDH
jgi:hypothetical protein